MRSWLDAQLCAYTETAAPFTAPAVGSSVAVDVYSSAFCVVGQTLMIAGAGCYLVAAIPVAGRLSLTNLGARGNAAAGTVVLTGSRVSPGGLVPFGDVGTLTTTDDTPQHAVIATLAAGEVRDLAARVTVKSADGTCAVRQTFRISVTAYCSDGLYVHLDAAAVPVGAGTGAAVCTVVEDESLDVWLVMTGIAATSLDWSWEVSAL